MRQFKGFVWGCAVLLSVAGCSGGTESEHIGSVSGKGMISKDKIHIEAFDDPDITGITCYATSYDNSWSWDNASDVSLSCRQTGSVNGTFADKGGVFSENKNPLFKVTVVDRFYDSKRNVLVYLAYTKDMKGSNASHSLSVVPIVPWAGERRSAPPAPSAE